MKTIALLLLAISSAVCGFAAPSTQQFWNVNVASNGAFRSVTIGGVERTTWPTSASGTISNIVGIGLATVTGGTGLIVTVNVTQASVDARVGSVYSNLYSVPTLFQVVTAGGSIGGGALTSAGELRFLPDDNLRFGAISPSGVLQVSRDGGSTIHTVWDSGNLTNASQLGSTVFTAGQAVVYDQLPANVATNVVIVPQPWMVGSNTVTFSGGVWTHNVGTNAATPFNYVTIDAVLTNATWSTTTAPIPFIAQSDPAGWFLSASNGVLTKANSRVTLTTHITGNGGLPRASIYLNGLRYKDSIIQSAVSAFDMSRSFPVLSNTLIQVYMPNGGSINGIFNSGMFAATDMSFETKPGWVASAKDFDCRWPSIIPSVAAQSNVVEEFSGIFTNGVLYGYVTGGWGLGAGSSEHKYLQTSTNYGETWSAPIIVISNHLRRGVQMVGNTLVAAVCTNDATTTAIDIYTSTDFTNFTATCVSCIRTGAPGAWDSGSIANSRIFIVNGATNIWYEAKQAGQKWQTGGATFTNGFSSPPVKWAGNPIVLPGAITSGSISSPYLWVSGSNLFMLCHGTASGALPTDIYEYYTATNNVPTNNIPTGWISASVVPMIRRIYLGEGANTALGQVADVELVPFDNNTVGVFFEALPNGGLPTSTIYRTLWMGGLDTFPR